MAKVTYVGTLSGLRIGSQIFPRDEAVEVSAFVAETLLGRDDFKAPTPPSKYKAKNTDTGDKAE